MTERVKPVSLVWRKSSVKPGIRSERPEYEDEALLLLLELLLDFEELLLEELELDEALLEERLVDELELRGKEPVELPPFSAEAFR